MNTSVSAIRIKSGSEQINILIEQYHLTFILLAMSFGVPRSAFGMVALLAMDSTDSDYLRVAVCDLQLCSNVRVGRYLFWWLLYRMQGIQISESNSPPGLDPLEWHVRSCRPTVSGRRCEFGACCVLMCHG